jgi:hypothetical protein
MTDPRRLVDHRLQDCYGFPLESGSGPVAEAPQAWVFSVAQLPVPGAPPMTSPAPMPTSLVCVPPLGRQRAQARGRFGPACTAHSRSAHALGNAPF